MSAFAYGQLFIAYNLWVIFSILNFVYYWLRHIYWRTNGLYARIVENRRPENYDKCAQVLRSLFLHRLDPFIEARESDFVLVHERFEHPEYVFRDDVTLLTVTETEAIFVQTQKGWSRPMYTYDFFIQGQVASTERLIKIPLNHFTKLAENMKDDGAKIIFLQNQGRCGGTLFTGIFKETGQCITFNEPHCFNAVVKHLYMNYVWTGATARRNLRNVVRMLCKPYHGLKDKPLAYIIKPTVTSILATEIIQDAMPDAVQFFLYRDPVAVAISLRRQGQILLTTKLVFHLPNIPGMMSPLFRLIGYCEVDFRGWSPKRSQELEFGYRVACLSMYRIQMALKHGVKVHCLRYNDLVKHRDKMIRQFFAICGIPDDLVTKGMVALDKDSQADSPISREILKAAMPNPPKPTEEFLEIAREMAREFGVPEHDKFKDESFRLPGSLQP